MSIRPFTRAGWVIGGSVGEGWLSLMLGEKMFLLEGL